jgi:hypothetical protein
MTYTWTRCAGGPARRRDLAPRIDTTYNTTLQHNLTTQQEDGDVGAEEGGIAATPCQPTASCGYRVAGD